jgi:nitrate reductase assembly molybdenum cofactor insertion protein NarJ
MSPVVTRTPVFDVDLLAALLRAPGQDYLALVERMRLEVAGVAPEAARHFGMFAERVRELDEAELEELYRESFGPADAVALRHAAGQMPVAGCGGCGDALQELERLLPALEAARNPFAVLFKAIVVLLIACRTTRTRNS